MEKIAVLIPCYNEESTVGKVVLDFKKNIPEATIYVYDNNSTDKTCSEATLAGAIVCNEYQQGKGNVVRSMFRNIQADIYVLVDGDDTYPAENVRELINHVSQGNFDMVVGNRLASGVYENENKRLFHNFGNVLVRALVNYLFSSNLNDIMSGYRVFSKRFVKNYPVLFEGFQLETDMTIFSLHRLFRIGEVPVPYRDRPKGSVSKLNTYKDGAKVLIAIFNLFRFYRPLSFFLLFSSLFFITGLAVGLPPIIEYLKYGYIYKIPSAILASGIMICSLILFAIGIILDTLRHSDREIFETLIRK